MNDETDVWNTGSRVVVLATIFPLRLIFPSWTPTCALLAVSVIKTKGFVSGVAVINPLPL